MPVRREKQVETVVVTQAVVEKQPFDAEGPIITAGDPNINNFVHYLIFQGSSRPSEESEDLLIDWTEEKKARNKPLKEFEDSESKVSQWIQFNEADMNSQFERYVFH